MSTFASRNIIDARNASHFVDTSMGCDWLDKANRICNPTGVSPGYGDLLMIRSDLDSLDLNAMHTLKFNQKTIQNLLVVTATPATPSARSDPNTLYHVRIADRRHRWRLRLLDGAFGLRVTPGGNLRASDMISSVPKTWQQVIDEIWDYLPEDGAAPTLPFTPDGYPDGFDFFGANAGEALGTVLDRLGCTLVLNWADDTFSIVRLGDTTAKEEFDLAIKSADRFRVDGDVILASNLGRIPKSVTVFFPIEPPPAYGGNPWKTIVVDDPGATVAGQEDGTTIPIYDDMTAEYQGTTLVNETDLEARADERAADYFRAIRKEGPVSSTMIYTGLRDDFAPGAWVSEIEWSCKSSKGWTTTVRVRPELPLAAWKGNKPQIWRETEIIRLAGTTSTVSVTGGTVTLLDGSVQIRNDSTGVFSDNFNCYVIDANSEIDAGDTSKISAKFTGFAGTRPVYFYGEAAGTSATCRKSLRGLLSSISGYSAGVKQALIKNTSNCLELVEIEECP